MGVEPTQDGSTAPQTVLKTAPVTGPEAAPRKDKTPAMHVGCATVAGPPPTPPGV